MESPQQTDNSARIPKNISLRDLILLRQTSVMNSEDMNQLELFTTVGMGFAKIQNLGQVPVWEYIINQAKKNTGTGSFTEEKPSVKSG